jgi:hypothetical protein
MDALIGFIGGMLKLLAFNVILFWIGWCVLKCLTLGRYPRTLDPRKPGSPDFEIFSMLGFLTLGALLILFAVRK